MTKEKLQERLALLNRERQQLLSACKIYDGAIQECTHWIAQFDLPDSPETE